MPVRSHTIGIISEFPVGSAVGFALHSSEHSTLRQCIFPGSIVYQVTNSIVIDVYTAISVQQIAPCTILILVIGDNHDVPQRIIYIDALCSTGDIAGIIISPSPGLARCSISFLNQLIGRIIEIARGFPLRCYGKNIAICVVCIAKLQVEVIGIVTMPVYYLTLGGVTCRRPVCNVLD